MEIPDLIDKPVITADGHTGSILSLYPRGVMVHIDSRFPMDVMAGRRQETLHYFYRYDQVTITSDINTCEICGTEPADECDHPKNGYCAKYQRPNK